MKYLIRLSSLFLSLMLVLQSNAQINSPWKTYGSQMINGVQIIPGSHTYSLTAGQGFSVYLKNQNLQPVTISGTLIAKTTCGNTVITKFTTSLSPGQSSSGTNFDNLGADGQTGVVTIKDCAGIKYTKTSYFINRISTVIVRYVQVKLIDNIVTQPAKSNDIATLPKKATASDTPVFDSLNYYKNHFYRFKDSIYSEYMRLKNTNYLLRDSLYKKNEMAITPAKATTVTSPATSSKVLRKVALAEETPEKENITLKILGGIGWDALPIISNFDTAASPFRYSYTRTTAHPLVQLGLLASVFNNQRVQLELHPFASYGINVSGDQIGNHLSYGITASALAHVVKRIPVKLCLMGNYTGRSGTWNKGISSADYQYSLIRYGAGIRWIGSNEAFWVQPNIYWDNNATAISGAQPSMVFGIEAAVADKWHVSVGYSTNYLNQGVVKYPAFADGVQSHIGIRFLGTIASIK